MAVKVPHDVATSSGGTPTDERPRIVTGERLQAATAMQRAVGFARSFSRSDALLRMFSALVSAQFITAFVGLVFWMAAARFLPAEEVGVAATAVASMTLISLFGMFGMSSWLIRDLADCHPADRRTRLRTGLAVSAAGGATVGLLWALVSPSFGDNFRATGGSVPVVALFVLGATTQTVCDAFDGAVLGLRRSKVQLVRTSIASVVKLALVPLLPLLDHRTGVALLATWIAGLLVSLAKSYGMLRTSLGNPLAMPTVPRATWLRLALPQAMRHHCLTVALASSGLLLPVVVSLSIDSREVAYFSTARFIFTAVLAVPFMLTMSLFATVAANPAELGDRIRQTIPLGLLLNIGMLAVMLPGAGIILTVFGGEYASGAAAALRLLVLAGLPILIKDHYVVVQRTNGRMMSAVAVVSVATVCEMVVAGVAGALWGLEALCVAWLGVLGCEAVYVFPTLRRALRQGTAQEA